MAEILDYDREHINGKLYIDFKSFSRFKKITRRK